MTSPAFVGRTITGAGTWGNLRWNQRRTVASLYGTTNMVKRQMKEIKRRTRVAMVFPNEKSLLRLVSAILMEVAEQWQQDKQYLPVESE
jgi:transposase-like protein